MTKVRLDTTFPHLYSAEVLDEFPSLESISQFYFPGATTRGGQDGLLVKVTPDQGLAWIGTFAFGYNSPKALTGLYTCPNPLSLSVVSSGRGYIANAGNPHDWEQVSIYPIMDMRTVIERQLILFADFTRIIAYGPQGLAWVTSNLSWDGLKITEITSDYIKGLAWDAPHEREVEFLVATETGKHDGGSSPEKNV